MQLWPTKQISSQIITNYILHFTCKNGNKQRYLWEIMNSQNTILLLHGKVITQLLWYDKK